MNTGCKLLAVERFVGGELAGEELRDVRRHIETCGGCATYAARLESERSAFLHEHPFSSFTRAHAPVSPLSLHLSVIRWCRQPVFLPAFSALLIAVLALPLVVGNQHGRSDVQFKGSASLECMVKRSGEVIPASGITRYRAGDQVQFMFPMATRRNVSLISIDSHGTVSFYHPDAQSKFCSVPAGPDSLVTFPGSMVLDDAPGAELVVVMFSSRELVRDSVNTWMKRQFETSRDVIALQKKLAITGGELAVEIVTMLLPKE